MPNTVTFPISRCVENGAEFFSACGFDRIRCVDRTFGFDDSSAQKSIGETADNRTASKAPPAAYFPFRPPPPEGIDELLTMTLVLCFLSLAFCCAALAACAAHDRYIEPHATESNGDLAPLTQAAFSLRQSASALCAVNSEKLTIPVEIMRLFRISESWPQSHPIEPTTTLNMSVYWRDPFRLFTPASMNRG